MNATKTQTAVPVDALRRAQAGDARALLAIPEMRTYSSRRSDGLLNRYLPGYELSQAIYSLPCEVRKSADDLLLAREARRKRRAVAESARTQPLTQIPELVRRGQYARGEVHTLLLWKRPTAKDGRSLLRIPEGRRLLASDQRRVNGVSISEIAGRRAIKEAKAIVADRQGRREARKFAESARKGESGRILRIGRERAQERREAKEAAIHPVLHEAFRGLYRVYDSAISVVVGTPDVRVRTTTKWVSGRGGFGRVTDSQVTHFQVPETWLEDVNARDLDSVDGMLTLSADLVSDSDGIEVYRATWVRQGRGYELHAESGHLARHTTSATTYHSANSDPAKAVSGLRRKLKAQAIPQEVRDARKAANAQARAARIARQFARLAERLAKWDLADIEGVRVTYQDSRSAGNCKEGTLEFAERHFPDRDPFRDSATIGEILQAFRPGRFDLASLGERDLKRAREIGAACLQAIRKDRNARRALA